MSSDFHDKNSDRQIKFESNLWKKYQNCKKIIIVDDSVDTGHSASLVKNAVSEFFKGAEVKMASLNYFEKAEKVFTPDYYLYKNNMLKGPWSNDSKENGIFLQKYFDWKQVNGDE